MFPVWHTVTTEGKIKTSCRTSHLLQNEKIQKQKNKKTTPKPTQTIINKRRAQQQQQQHKSNEKTKAD